MRAGADRPDPGRADRAHGFAGCTRTVDVPHRCCAAPGSHRTLLEMLSQRFERQDLLLDNAPDGSPASPSLAHDLDLRPGRYKGSNAVEARPLAARAAGLGVQALSWLRAAGDRLAPSVPAVAGLATCVLFTSMPPARTAAAKAVPVVLAPGCRPKRLRHAGTGCLSGTCCL
jgi:hypothetical protein